MTSSANVSSSSSTNDVFSYFYSSSLKSYDFLSDVSSFYICLMSVISSLCCVFISSIILSSKPHMSRHLPSHPNAVSSSRHSSSRHYAVSSSRHSSSRQNLKCLVTCSQFFHLKTSRHPCSRLPSSVHTSSLWVVSSRLPSSVLIL